METLDGLLNGLSAPDRAEGHVDVSDLFGKPVVFVYREPSVPELFAASGDAAQFRKMNPEWTEELAQTVALLALCHVEPRPGPGQKVGLLYAGIVENTDLFMRLSKGWADAFPHLSNMKEAVAAKKKLSVEDSGD